MPIILEESETILNLVIRIWNYRTIKKKLCSWEFVLWQRRLVIQTWFHWELFANLSSIQIFFLIISEKGYIQYQLYVSGGSTNRTSQGTHFSSLYLLLLPFSYWFKSILAEDNICRNYSSSLLLNKIPFIEKGQEECASGRDSYRRIRFLFRNLTLLKNWHQFDIINQQMLYNVSLWSDKEPEVCYYIELLSVDLGVSA